MSNQLALVKKDTVDVVAEKVRQFQERGEIHFPLNYSPENAMKSAWLALQSTMDRNGKPALEVCSRDSVANSLLDMVVQGLNPSKKQGYFIVYGNKLVFQRSYFGTMAVTKSVTKAEDIDAQIVYKGDDFEFEIVRGRKRVTRHTSKLENINDDNMVAAYCSIFWPDGKEYTEIMTIEEIKTSWKKSKQNPEKEGSTHQEFPGEMAKRTVINRACKGYMNSSDDGTLVMKHFKSQDDAMAEAEVDAEIEENANRTIIDIKPDPEPAPAASTPKADPVKEAAVDQDILEFERNLGGNVGGDVGPGF